MLNALIELNRGNDPFPDLDKARSDYKNSQIVLSKESALIVKEGEITSADALLPEVECPAGEIVKMATTDVVVDAINSNSS